MSPDWAEIFGVDKNLFELALRTSSIYLLLLIGLRLIGRREMGTFELPDLLLITLIADGVQNAMADEYKTVTSGLVVAGTLLGWNYALDFLSFHVPLIRRLTQPAPLRLVEDGRLLRRNMRRELITEDELRSQLRAQGVEDLAEVRRAQLEPTGDLSITKRDAGDDGPPQRRRRPVG